MSWLYLVLGASATSKAIKTTEQREFHISGETFLCVEQDLDVDAKVGHLNSIHCSSDARLEVTFTPYLGVGKEHDAEFYVLLEQIQKI